MEMSGRRYGVHGSSVLFQAVLIVLLTHFASVSPVFACGDIFDVECNLTHGGLSPGNIAKQTQKAGQDVANAATNAAQDVANAVNELQASTLSGPALEQAIVASRNTAINGAMQIPPQIRQQLAGYASDDSMNRVRYKIGDNGFANLARLLEQGGAASAVTLVDVIIFRGPTEAGDPALWAHELTHVDQYRDWGAHSFAVQYARNWQSVENPAYAKGNGFAAWRQQHQFAQQSFPPPAFPPPAFPQPWPTMPPQNIGAFCYTAFGRFGPGPIQPIGAPCFVPTPQGNAPGQIGP